MIWHAMHRRSLLTLLGAAAAAWPLAARAQQAGRLPTIGFLGGTTPAQYREFTAAYVQRLRELGWIEGRNVAIEYRWAEGRAERSAEIVAEFVRRKVDVMQVSGNLDALIAKRATSVIPIVFTIAGDPVGTGLVASLARPGGNVTGLSTQLTDAAGKRLELLREVAPAIRRIAVLSNAANPLSAVEVSEIRAAASVFGLELVAIEVRRPEDIMPAMMNLNQRADALYVANDALFAAHRLRVTSFALAARLPTIFSQRDRLDVGGLMSYGTDFTPRWRRAAELVDKILRGTKPADIPVEQPTKFDLVVDLITAKAIGLTIPESFLVRADEVIE